MLFFRKRRLSATERLEIALREKQQLRQNLARRLNTAEMFVTDRREASERLALDGASDEVLSRAEASTRATEDRARTLRAALEQLEAEITYLEHELGSVVERRCRDTVADVLETMVASIAQTAPGYDAAATTLIEAVTKSAGALPEATVLAADLEAMRREVGSAAALICAELRVVAARTRSGEAKIAFRAPSEPQVPFLLQIEREAAPAVPLEGQLLGPGTDGSISVGPIPMRAIASTQQTASHDPFEDEAGAIDWEPPDASNEDLARANDAAAAAA